MTKEEVLRTVHDLNVQISTAKNIYDTAKQDIKKAEPGETSEVYLQHLKSIAEQAWTLWQNAENRLEEFLMADW